MLQCRAQEADGLESSAEAINVPAFPFISVTHSIIDRQLGHVRFFPLHRI